mmetsp:Transcript_21593/g.48552  ORF Transcript_21593/g.48552 Transcript_21593/m.48552 type:complete len:112 (-) Transcript_21593:458-793(-)
MHVLVCVCNNTMADAAFFAAPSTCNYSVEGRWKIEPPILRVLNRRKEGIEGRERKDGGTAEENEPRHKPKRMRDRSPGCVRAVPVPDARTFRFEKDPFLPRSTKQNKTRFY